MEKCLWSKKSSLPNLGGNIAEKAGLQQDNHSLHSLFDWVSRVNNLHQSLPPDSCSFRGNLLPSLPKFLIKRKHKFSMKTWAGTHTAIEAKWGNPTSSLTPHSQFFVPLWAAKSQIFLA